MIYPYHFDLHYSDWHWHLLGKVKVSRLPRHWLHSDDWDEGHERDHKEYLAEMDMSQGEYDSWTNPYQAGRGGKL